MIHTCVLFPLGARRKSSNDMTSKCQESHIWAPKKLYGNVVTLIVTLVLVGVYLDWRVNVLPKQTLHMVVQPTKPPLVRSKTRKYTEARRVEHRAVEQTSAAIKTKAFTVNTPPGKKNYLYKTIGESYKANAMPMNLSYVGKQTFEKAALITPRKDSKARLGIGHNSSALQSLYSIRSRKRSRRVVTTVLVTNRGWYLYFNVTRDGHSSITRVRKQEMDIMNLVIMIWIYVYLHILYNSMKIA